MDRGLDEEAPRWACWIMGSRCEVNAEIELGGPVDQRVPSSKTEDIMHIMGPGAWALQRQGHREGLGCAGGLD